MYGEKNAVSNVHTAKHLAECTQFIDPPFTYSNYHFEDNIGHLVSLHKGTTDVTSQIAEKYLLEKDLFHYLESSTIAKQFYEDIDSKHKYSVCRKVKGSVVIGKPNEHLTLSEQERTLIADKLNIACDTKIEQYDSVLLNSKIYYETSMKSKKRTDDSFVFNCSSEKFAKIKSIFVIHEKLFFLLDEKYEVLMDATNKCKSITYLEELDTDRATKCVVKPESIGPKFALEQFENVITCSKFPNLYERD